jgi:hypothetical protein
VLATSSEGYAEKRSCLAAIESVKRDVVDAPVVEQQPDNAASKTDDAKPAAPKGAPKGAPGE